MLFAYGNATKPNSEDITKDISPRIQDSQREAKIFILALQ